MRKLGFVVLTSAASLALCATPAFASTASANFNVTATIGAAACTIAATDLNFGTYVPANASPLDAQSQITVTCPSSTAWNVGLSGGLNQNVSQRAMAGPQLNGQTVGLLYAIYSDAARTHNWGNTVGTDTVAGTGTGASQAVPVYGRIPAGQAAINGSYADQITATITF